MSFQTKKTSTKTLRMLKKVNEVFSLNVEVFEFRTISYEDYPVL